MVGVNPTSVSVWMSGKAGRMHDRFDIGDAIPRRGSRFNPTSQVIQLPEDILHILWQAVLPRWDRRRDRVTLGVVASAVHDDVSEHALAVHLCRNKGKSHSRAFRRILYVCSR